MLTRKLVSSSPIVSDDEMVEIWVGQESFNSHPVGMRALVTHEGSGCQGMGVVVSRDEAEYTIIVRVFWDRRHLGNK